MNYRLIINNYKLIIHKSRWRSPPKFFAKWNLHCFFNGNCMHILHAVVPLSLCPLYRKSMVIHMFDNHARMLTVFTSLCNVMQLPKPICVRLPESAQRRSQQLWRHTGTQQGQDPGAWPTLRIQFGFDHSFFWSCRSNFNIQSITSLCTHFIVCMCVEGEERVGIQTLQGVKKFL